MLRSAIVALLLAPLSGCYLSHGRTDRSDADASEPACPSRVLRTFDIEILTSDPAGCAVIGHRRIMEIDLAADEVVPDPPCVGHVARAADGCALDFDLDCPLIDAYTVSTGRFEGEPPSGIVHATTTGWGTCERTERWTARGP